MEELCRQVATLQAECRSRQVALERMIEHVLNACQAIVSAKELADIQAAAMGLAEEIELELESPQLETFRHLRVA